MRILVDLLLKVCTCLMFSVGFDVERTVMPSIFRDDCGKVQLQADSPLTLYRNLLGTTMGQRRIFGCKLIWGIDDTMLGCPPRPVSP